MENQENICKNCFWNNICMKNDENDDNCEYFYPNDEENIEILYENECKNELIERESEYNSIIEEYN